MPDEEIVRVKKSDLEKLINANVEAYNKLDEISTSATDVEEGIKSAFRTLEDMPTELSDIIVEEEEKE